MSLGSVTGVRNAFRRDQRIGWDGLYPVFAALLYVALEMFPLTSLPETTASGSNFRRTPFFSFVSASFSLPSAFFFSTVRVAYFFPTTGLRILVCHPHTSDMLLGSQLTCCQSLRLRITMTSTESGTSGCICMWTWAILLQRASTHRWGMKVWSSTTHRCG